LGRVEKGSSRLAGFAAVGSAAEDVVGFVEDHFADFFVGEGPVGFGLDGFFVGDFLEVGGGAGEAGQGVELAGVVDGVVVEFAFLEGLKDLAEADVDDGLWKFEVGGMGSEVAGVFADFAHLIEPFLVVDVGLVTALEPVGNVLLVEGDAEFVHFGDDVGVGLAVIEHLVDEEALVGREFGDFSEELGDGRGLEVEGGKVGRGGERGGGGGFGSGEYGSHGSYGSYE
jgi:hypothetical protein